MAKSSVEQCISLVNEIENMVNDASPFVMSRDRCVVSRDVMLQKLSQLRASLPNAMTTAAEYVRNIDAITQQNEQECATKLQDAEQRSTGMVADAEKQAEALKRQSETEANDMLQQAETQARSMVESAQAEAAQILDSARHQADVMVSQDEVLRRARVGANEAAERCQNELAMARKNTFEYLDGVMSEMDRFLSNSLNELRTEHAQLNNNR